MAEPWVLAQQRTLTRWVSSKIGREITDITVDLSDGLVLIDLVNQVGEDTGDAPYKIAPVYKKPNFPIQKMDNVDYVLQFSRVILQMNICNLSAEDIVAGNLKLILGLVWSIFVYSSTVFVPKSSQSRSVGEIKTIVLRWLNIICKRKALPVLTNFNRDWSIQQEQRPDLVFAAILDYYVPLLNNYRQSTSQNRYEELARLINVANAQLRIPKLAEADDFDVLLPDEKCVLLYVLEWYMFFEIKGQENEIGSGVGQMSPTSKVTPAESLGEFFSSVIRAVKLKNKYDTRSLRLSNKLTSHIRRVQTRLEALRGQAAASTLHTLVDRFCDEIDKADNFEHQLSERNYTELMASRVRWLQTMLDESIMFKLEVNPAMVYSDIPELRSLMKSLNLELKKAGFMSAYEASKCLSIESLLSRSRSLLEEEDQLCNEIKSVIKNLLDTNLSKIDDLIAFVARMLPSADKNASEAVQNFASGLDVLLHLRNKMHEYQVTMGQEHTTADIKALADSMEYYDLPQTPLTPEESLFIIFREAVENQNNRSNLTYSDIKRILCKFMPEHQFQGSEFHEFMRLIPTRTLLPRSESNEFGMTTHSEDSDDSDAVFDKVSKALESKLSGTEDKIYDLALLISRMDSGFQV